MKATIDPEGFEVQRDSEGYIIPDDIEEILARASSRHGFGYGKYRKL